MVQNLLPYSRFQFMRLEAACFLLIGIFTRVLKPYVINLSTYSEGWGQDTVPAVTELTSCGELFWVGGNGLFSSHVNEYINGLWVRNEQNDKVAERPKKKIDSVVLSGWKEVALVRMVSDASLRRSTWAEAWVTRTEPYLDLREDQPRWRIPGKAWGAIRLPRRASLWSFCQESRWLSTRY